MDSIVIMIGNNLAQIRRERGLSLDNVSELTGVSKGMLSQIEKGQKTPSVTILWKIANGLKVSMSSLMKSSQSTVSVLTLNKANMLSEDEGKYRTGSLLPFDGETKFEVLKMELEPGGVHKSGAHTTGVVEYVLVGTGEMEIEIEEKTYKAKSGDAIMFQGDVEHTYRNYGEEAVNAFIVIYYSK